MERADKSEATRKMVIANVAVFALYYFTKFLAPIASMRFGVDKMLFGIALRSVLALVALIALGGARWLRPSIKSVGHMWRFMGYLIVLQVLLGVIALLSTVASMTDAQIDALTPDTLGGNFAYITILCVLVGINEEVMFRGLFLGGLLARLGDRKSGVIASAVISSLVFGAFHVIGSLDPSN
ncbi:MAG: CPBP family intramembrane metalloprotease, partial [Atopobiaceae bacterium]|nr:CPBP family intramembrane metalloprotease [Atopobiaceae bacterium]